jgi:hypothetical protein
MSYHEENNSVILTMSREDYALLLARLEIGSICIIKTGGVGQQELALLGSATVSNCSTAHC